MACVTLYGLNETRGIVATKIFVATEEVLRLRAEEHLERYPAVEVWEGRVCKLRLERLAALRSSKRTF
jgi:hypothetical protein